MNGFSSGKVDNANSYLCKIQLEFGYDKPDNKRRFYYIIYKGNLITERNSKSLVRRKRRTTFLIDVVVFPV